MFPKTNRAFRYLISVFGLGAVIGWSSPSDAYIQRIVIDQTATVNFTPIILGTSTPGTSTSYTIYTGRIFGELKPNDPDNNKIITDIDLAPKNKGRVEYVADFEIITPSDPTQRSGLMIHEVPNRGGNAINTSALIQGATYVQSGWQGDLLAQCSPSPAIPYPCFDLNSGPYGSLNTITGVFTPPQVSDVAGASGVKSLASFVVQVPVATNPNGKNPITGQVYSHVCTGTNGCGLAVGTTTSTAQLEIQGPAFAPYQPASMDTNQAQFWTVSSQTFEGVDSEMTLIPSIFWGFNKDENGRTVPVTLNGHAIGMLLDTGAQKSMLGEAAVRRLNLVRDPISHFAHGSEWQFGPARRPHLMRARPPTASTTSGNTS